MSSSISFVLLPPSSLPIPPFPTHTPVSKGLTTYDYIVLQREKDLEGNAAGPERGYHGRCGFLRRKVSRILTNLLATAFITCSTQYLFWMRYLAFSLSNKFEIGLTLNFIVNIHCKWKHEFAIDITAKPNPSFFTHGWRAIYWKWGCRLSREQWLCWDGQLWEDTFTGVFLSILSDVVLWFY